MGAREALAFLFKVLSVVVHGVFKTSSCSYITSVTTGNHIIFGLQNYKFIQNIQMLTDTTDNHEDSDFTDEEQSARAASGMGLQRRDSVHGSTVSSLDETSVLCNKTMSQNTSGFFSVFPS